MRNIFLSICIASTALASRPDPAINVEELFGSALAQHVVKEAESLAVCLLLPSSGDWQSPPRRYEEYMERACRPVPEEAKDNLVELLFDEATYHWRKVITAPDVVTISRKGCIPAYHIRVKAQKGDDAVDVSFCFGCSDAVVALNGRPANGADLGARSEELLDLFRSVHPDDELLSQVGEFVKMRSAAGQWPEQTTHPGLIRVFGSDVNIAIVRRAEEVTGRALVLDWEAARPQGKGLMFPDGPSPKAVPPEVAAQIQAVLLQASTYPISEEEKECAPDYHIRVSFRRATEQLEVSFCFACDILQVHRGTEVISEVDCDGGSNPLFELLLSVFPQDPTMQMLKERREAWRKNRQGQRRKKRVDQPRCARSWNCYGNGLPTFRSGRASIKT